MRIYIFIVCTLLAGCSTVAKILERFPPVIKTFEASLEKEAAPAEVLFSWDISDRDSKALSCTLSYGDSVNQKVENCDQVSDVFHTYEQAGSYVAKLTVSDGKDTVSDTVPVVIEEKSEPDEPTDDLISQFIAEPDSGVAPLLSIFRWVIDTDEAVTCTLTFDDGEDEKVENCQELSDTFHEFSEPGAYRVVLEASGKQRTEKKSLIIVVKPAPESP